MLLRSPPSAPTAQPLGATIRLQYHFTKVVAAHIRWRLRERSVAGGGPSTVALAVNIAPAFAVAPAKSPHRSLDHKPSALSLRICAHLLTLKPSRPRCYFCSSLLTPFSLTIHILFLNLFFNQSL